MVVNRALFLVLAVAALPVVGCSNWGHSSSEGDGRSSVNSNEGTTTNPAQSTRSAPRTRVEGTTVPGENRSSGASSGTSGESSGSGTGTGGAGGAR